ncbi:hypothetical protein VTK56DRAFT_2245 [Thermocarpiscus australiensis]
MSVCALLSNLLARVGGLVGLLVKLGLLPDRRAWPGVGTYSRIHDVTPGRVAGGTEEMRGSGVYARYGGLWRHWV